MSEFDNWVYSTRSSTIEKFGWEQGPEVDLGTLSVVFKNGARYQYANVPYDTYAAMGRTAEGEFNNLQDASVGKFFAKHVKGCFDFRKVEIYL